MFMDAFNDLHGEAVLQGPDLPLASTLETTTVVTSVVALLATHHNYATTKYS